MSLKCRNFKITALGPADDAGQPPAIAGPAKLPAIAVTLPGSNFVEERAHP